MALQICDQISQSRQNDSRLQLRLEHRNHAWYRDFVEHRTRNGRKHRTLKVIDEFTHERRAIRVARKPRAIDVICIRLDLSSLCGVSSRVY